MTGLRAEAYEGLGLMLLLWFGGVGLLEWVLVATRVRPFEWLVVATEMSMCVMLFLRGSRVVIVVVLQHRRR